MNIILCVDDHMGMAFNKRRQSRDRVVQERILAQSKGHALWMTSYSAREFHDAEGICVSERFLQEAASDDWCFIETENPVSYAEQIQQIVLYRWNRHYPADVYCTLPLEQWKHVSLTEIPGFSHEMITEEKYQR